MWELVKKKGPGGGRVPSGPWATDPMVRVNKGAIILNERFMKDFGISSGDAVLVYFDVPGQRLGIRKAVDSDDTTHAWVVGRNVKGGADGRVACKKVNEAFPFVQCGSTFRPSLNGAVISIDLKNPVS